MAKMLLSSLVIFIHTDFVPVFLLQGHCQHLKNHCHPDSPLYVLHPQSHCKSNPCTGAGLSSAPRPFSGSHTARKPTLLLDPSLQRHPDTLLHQSQAFHVWWATAHKRMEMRMTLAGCLCIGAAPLTWTGHTPHPLLTPSRSWSHQPGVDVQKHCLQLSCALCSYHGQQTKKVKAWFFFFGCKILPMRYGFWDGVVAFCPAHCQRSSKNGMERGETTFTHTSMLQPDYPDPGDICHKHVPEHSNLTLSLLARQHRTFGLILDETFGLILLPQVLPNAPRQRFHFLPPVSSTSWPSPVVLVQTDSTALGKAGSEPVCVVERQWAGQEGWPEHLPESGAGCCPDSWLALLVPG